MLGGGAVKDLYEKGKGRSVRGIASDLGISRATVCKYVRSPEVPKPKARPEARIEIGRLQGVHRRQGVRGSGELRGADSGRGIWPYDRESATALFNLVSARYERGSIILTANKGFCGLEGTVGRHDDSDDDTGTTPQLRSQHLQRELQTQGQASGRSADVALAADINCGGNTKGRLKGSGCVKSNLAKMPEVQLRIDNRERIFAEMRNGRRHATKQLSRTCKV